MKQSLGGQYEKPSSYTRAMSFRNCTQYSTALRSPTYTECNSTSRSSPKLEKVLDQWFHGAGWVKCDQFSPNTSSSKDQGAMGLVLWVLDEMVVEASLLLLTHEPRIICRRQDHEYTGGDTNRDQFWDPLPVVSSSWEHGDIQGRHRVESECQAQSLARRRSGRAQSVNLALYWR